VSASTPRMIFVRAGLWPEGDCREPAEDWEAAGQLAMAFTAMGPWRLDITTDNQMVDVIILEAETRRAVGGWTNPRFERAVCLAILDFINAGRPCRVNPALTG
jgi:hypothetical protein